MHSRKRSKFLLLIFVLSIASSSARAAIIDRIAAIVNDDIITQSELYAVQQLGLWISGLPKEDSVLQRRINERLVLQQLTRQPPVSISDEDVQAVLTSLAREHHGREDLLLFLNSIGMSYADLEKEVRNQLTIKAFLRGRFRPFVTIPLEDAEKYYNMVYKPSLELQGKEVPPFAESFEHIQDLLTESQVQEKTVQWLVDLRKAANISVKE